MEDRRNALFVEPNAYIQRVEKKEKSPSKILFQEPYESMPNYYLNNGFKKGECDCVHKEKPKEKNNGFDIKSLVPILGSFGGEMSGLSKILQGVGSGNGLQGIISTILSNPDMVKSVMKIFAKNEKKTSREHIKKSDLQIKNYTKVE